MGSWEKAMNTEDASKWGPGACVDPGAKPQHDLTLFAQERQASNATKIVGRVSTSALRLAAAHLADAIRSNASAHLKIASIRGDVILRELNRRSTVQRRWWMAPEPDPKDDQPRLMYLATLPDLWPPDELAPPKWRAWWLRRNKELPK